MKQTFPLLFLAFILLFACANEKSEKKADVLNHTIQEGDIIFQTSQSRQSKAIQLATHSKYSHVGIIFKMNDVLVVYEAVQPVIMTPMDEWIKRGKGGHYVIKRIKNSEEVLTTESLKKMKRIGNAFMGKDYDLYFEWSDEKMYCSEFVWKIYKQGADIEIGALAKLSDFDLESEIVKNKLAERYGTHIPMDEKVISPAQMFNSDKLLVVKQN